MIKKDAFNLFVEGQFGLSKYVGIDIKTVYRWPDELSNSMTLRVIGAAFKAVGDLLPDQRTEAEYRLALIMKAATNGCYVFKVQKMEGL